MITYTPKWGVSIEQAAGEAIGLSAKESKEVLLQFNHREILVNHFSCINSIIDEYYREDIQENKPEEKSMLTYIPDNGITIDKAAEAAVLLSKEKGCRVLLCFNGVEIAVDYAKGVENTVEEYYTKVDTQGMLMEDNKDKSVDNKCILDELAPLLTSHWSANTKDECIIHGEWAEDFSDYEIKVPPQLRDVIIKMQHYMYNNYKKLMEYKKEISDTKRRFKCYLDS